MEEWGTIITTITTILPFPTNQRQGKDATMGFRIWDFGFLGFRVGVWVLEKPTFG